MFLHLLHQLFLITDKENAQDTDLYQDQARSLHRLEVDQCEDLETGKDITLVQEKEIGTAFFRIFFIDFS